MAENRGSFTGVLDLDTIQQLLDLSDGSLDLLQEMVQLYKDDVPGRIAALETAFLQGRLEEMGDLAHAVKGAAGTMGAPGVREIAQALETAGRAGTGPAPSEGQVRSLKDAFQASIGALDAFIAEKEQAG